MLFVLPNIQAEPNFTQFYVWQIPNFPTVTKCLLFISSWSFWAPEPLSTSNTPNTPWGEFIKNHCALLRVLNSVGIEGRRSLCFAASLLQCWQWGTFCSLFTSIQESEESCWLLSLHTPFPSSTEPDITSTSRCISDQSQWADLKLCLWSRQMKARVLLFV